MYAGASSMVLECPVHKEIQGAYRVITEVRTDSFGLTYLLLNKESRIPYVLKCFEKREIKGQDGVSLFKRRLLILSKAEFKSISRPIEIIDTQEYLCYIRENYEFQSLEDIVERGDSIDRGKMSEIFLSICSVFSFIHTHSIYPTLLSPSTIFIDSSWNVIVADLNPVPSLPYWSLRKPDIHILTFLPPEYFDQSQNMDASSDVWSLCVLLVYMFSGAFPLRTNNFVAMIKQILGCDFSFPACAPKRIVEIAKAGLISAKKERMDLAETMKQASSYKSSILSATNSGKHEASTGNRLVKKSKVPKLSNSSPACSVFEVGLNRSMETKSSYPDAHLFFQRTFCI